MPRLVLSVEEEQRLLAACPNHLKYITIGALDSGMRRGELLHQKCEHIDFTRRLLFVTRSKTAGGKSREIPLTARFFEVLSTLRQEEGVGFLYRGKPIADVKTAWKHALERAGLRHIRFHDLRHSFNTRLIEAGVISDVRMALMGHSSGQRTHAIYTHISIQAKRDAIARLEAWVKKQQQNQQLEGGKDGYKTSV